MPKSVDLIVGLFFLISKVSSDGDIHGGLGSGLESAGLFGRYGDYGSYGRYASPTGYFGLGYTGVGQGLGYGGIGSGYDNIGHRTNTFQHTGIGYHPNTIGRVGDVYGRHGLNGGSPVFYGSPVGYNSFGYNNIGLGYGGYGSGIKPYFGTHGYGDYTPYGFSPSFGYGLGIPHGYADGYGGHGGYGGYGLHRTGGIHQSTELVKAGYGNNDGTYEKEHGEKDQLSHRTGDGFSSVHDAEKNAKGGAGYYADINAGENGYQNVKSFQGEDHYDQAAKKGEEGKNALAHRKGHVTKGFETSHHKDETGKTTTFFDEGNDEGNRFNYGGQHGSVVDSRVNAYHGGLKDNNFHTGKHSEKGEYDQGFLKDRENANKLAYNNRVHYGSNNEYGGNSGTGSHVLGGNFKSNQLFQQYPYFHY